jgi:hypothetical protein
MAIRCTGKQITAYSRRPWLTTRAESRTGWSSASQRGELTPYKELMRIVLLDQTTKGWSAGTIFTQMMLACLELANRDRDMEVIFLSRSRENTPSGTFKSIFNGEQPDRMRWTESLKDAALDVVIPVRDHTVFDVDLPFVG